MIGERPSPTRGPRPGNDADEQLVAGLRALLAEHDAHEPPQPSARVLLHPVCSSAPPASRLLEQVVRLQRQQELRARFVETAVAGGPAWPMLLELFRARVAGERVLTKQLVSSAAVPGTTGLRWIQFLVKVGYAERYGSSTDRRLALLRITPKGFSALEAYLRYLDDHGLG